MTRSASPADPGQKRRATARFAPSPNGELHLGHAYSALTNQRWASRHGGRLLLRMEDIDLARCTPANEAAIRHDLAWLGVGPLDLMPRQSERFPVYAAVLDTLRRGGQIYPCFCTRGDIVRVVSGRPGWPRDPDGAPLYPGTCRHRHDAPARLAAGEPAAWRIDMTAALHRHPGPLTWAEYDEGERPRREAATPAVWGDVLLARKDVPASYHLAVVVDDAAQGVTDILRGEDLRPSTSLHRLLQHMLGHPAPRYHHHRLVRDDQGRKLAKSAGSPSLRSLREAGATPADIRARLGFAPS